MLVYLLYLEINVLNKLWLLFRKASSITNLLILINLTFENSQVLSTDPNVSFCSSAAKLTLSFYDSRKKWHFRKLVAWNGPMTKYDVILVFLWTVAHSPASLSLPACSSLKFDWRRFGLCLQWELSWLILWKGGISVIRTPPLNSLHHLKWHSCRNMLNFCHIEVNDNSFKLRNLIKISIINYIIKMPCHYF